MQNTRWVMPISRSAEDSIMSSIDLFDSFFKELSWPSLFILGSESGTEPLELSMFPRDILALQFLDSTLV